LPAYYDVRADTPEGRASIRNADRYTPSLAKLFLRVSRDILTDEYETAFARAYEAQDISGIFGVLEEAREKAEPIFLESLVEIYSEILNDVGREALRVINEEQETQINWTLAEIHDETAVEIVKAKYARRVPVNPINPYSEKWMREESLAFVQQGVTEQQLKVVQSILVDGYNKGIRANAAYKQIQANIGLTEREYQAVKNRSSLLEAAGFSENRLDRAVDRYRQQLLSKRAQRIARTETIRAQSAGRQAAWKMAEDEGAFTAQVEREWVTMPESPVPGKPCEICEELDGKRAKLGEPYESSIIGIVEGPGWAHPHCMCTERLVRADSQPGWSPPRKTMSRTLKEREIRLRTPQGDSIPEPRLVITHPLSGQPINLTNRQVIADQQSRWIGDNERRFLAMPRADRWTFLLWNWVHGSARWQSVRLKKALKQEFNLAGIVWNPLGQLIQQRHLDDMRRDVRALYEQTQKDLAFNSIQSITLYKGVSGTVTARGVLESWTADKVEALQLGPLLLRVAFPAESIFNFRGSSTWIDSIWGEKKIWLVMT